MCNLNISVAFQILIAMDCELSYPIQLQCTAMIKFRSHGKNPLLKEGKSEKVKKLMNSN